MMDFGMPTLLELPELEDCGRLCRALGLQFVELNMNLPQYQTDTIDAARFQKVRERFGVYFTLHLDENLNPADFNSYVARAYRETVRDAVRLAKTLEAPVLNMHLSRGIHFTLPGKKVDLFGVHAARYLKDMQAFRDMCEAEIGDSGILICVENTDGYTDFQIEAMDMLLESPVFGLTFDIGHDYCAGNTDEAVILRRRERLAHFHLHDAKGKSCHLPFGEGELDIERFLRMAEESKSRAVLEVKTISGLKKSAQRFQGRHTRAPGRQRGQ